MNNILVSIIIIIIIVLVWIWYMECNHPVFDSVWIDEILKKAKTGDLILFKATDNMNSSKIFCYYTHIGVVWRPDNSTPLIFEAAGTTGMDLYDTENKNGIFLTDLKTRLERYNGNIYYKELNSVVKPQYCEKFCEFIDYAKKNMYYNYSVLLNGLKKGLYLETCTNATNCAELAVLSLIRLGILDFSHYNNRAFHHLYWICNLEQADGNYKYLTPCRIKVSPFI